MGFILQVYYKTWL